MSQAKTPLADWLVRACEARGLSWAEASRRAGLSQGAILAIVRGTQPGLAVCKGFASFFGPPLSAGCDGHHALAFDAVQPGYAAFADLFLGQLGYSGTLVCIGPKTTHMGAIRRLYERIRAQRDDFGLRLIHHSCATITGAGTLTPPRLKYVELWFSGRLPDTWETRRSRLARLRSVEVYRPASDETASRIGLSPIDGRGLSLA